MWSDNETTEDLLGFQVHADLIRSIVINPDMLPITIGIFGDCGMSFEDTEVQVMSNFMKSISPIREQRF